MRPMGGMTLLELVIALAIVSVLAAIAVPAYRSYVVRANRADARGALLALSTAQEKLYLQCNTYTTNLDAGVDTSCNPLNLRYPTSSERGLYTLAVTSADASAWSATATVASGSAQAADTACHAFELDSRGTRTAVTSDGAPGDSTCWSR